MKSQLASLLPPSLRPRTLLRRHLERATRAGRVLAGPFAGMRYVGSSVGSMWWPKILGTYEIELSALIEESCRAAPALVIDIGAAEGYYAVGLAWRCPAARVISFESEAAGRALQAELAELNGVTDRLRIEGPCDHAALRRALTLAPERGLLICDIEGGELDLLDPALVPELRRPGWTLLIEIHDHVDPSIFTTLVNRFYVTHTIEEIVARPRTAPDLPRTARRALLSRWTPAYLDERRPGPMRWLLLRATA